MKLACLPNLSTSTVSYLEPWKLKIPARGKTKEEYVRWLQKKDTKYCCFSGYEGLDPKLRVTAANPACATRALVLDFDCGGPGGDEWKDMVQQAREFRGAKPNWLGRTFSTGARAIWFFDRPVLVHEKVWKRALSSFVKEEKLDRLFHSLDKGFADPTKYYALGDSWITLGSSSLEANRLYSYCLKESARVNWVIDSEKVSIDDVASEVEARFPGRWPGDFILGARGPRFWDDSADNPTAAIVREAGMQCFTGPDPFVPWSRIFGAKWVSDRMAERTGAAVKDLFFDGQQYWHLVDGVWRAYSRVDTMLHLKTAGLSNDGDPSEQETALRMIQTECVVDAAVPLIHHPPGIVKVMSNRFLNVSRVRVVPPHNEPSRDWGDGFPKLGEFLAGLFEDVDGEDAQTPHFLAWLQRYYKGALAKQPVPGQVVFLAGEVEQGKNFTSNVILSRLMGGHADASTFLLGKTQFTGHLMDAAIWSIDDTLAGDDRVHAHYSSMIKKMPANQTFLYDDKFVRAKMIPWMGRLVVTCNLDNESLRIIPNAEQSLLDKIMLFKISVREGVDFRGIAEALADELPHFARWLHDWDADAHGVLEYSRFGVTPYHHPQLLMSAREVMPSQSFLELLKIFLDGWYESNKATVWMGNPTELLYQMSQDDSMKSLLSRYNAVYVGRLLSQLANQGYKLQQVRKSGYRVWSIENSALHEPK